jgi:methyl-accepting chemotaxis protein
MFDSLRGGGPDVEEIVSRVERRAEGDLETALDTDRDDAVGRLNAVVEELVADRRELREELEAAEAVNSRAERQVTEYREVMQACADGQLDERMDADRDVLEVADEFNAMMDELEAAVQELEAFVGLVVSSSEAVTGETTDVRATSERISGSMQEIAEGATRQSRRLSSLNGEMDQLSSNIEEIAEAATEVAELSERTVDTGHEGRAAAREAIDRMGDTREEAADAVEAIEQLDEEMAYIGKVTDFISDVAEQTNMLALNANIEASRASSGDDGGFAAVAAEIKQLSQKTQEAAGEIEDRLDRIREQTGEASDAVGRTSRTLDESTDAVENAAEAFAEVARLAEETNEGVHGIESTVQQQSQSAREVVSLADETATISDETSERAEEIASAAAAQTEALTTVVEEADELTANANGLSETLGAFEIGDYSAEAVRAGHVDGGGDSRIGDGSTVEREDGDGDGTGADAEREDAGQPAARDGGSPPS